MTFQSQPKLSCYLVPISIPFRFDAIFTNNTNSADSPIFLISTATQLNMQLLSITIENNQLEALRLN